MTIHCAICLNIRKGKDSQTPATTTIRGYSVCDAHVELASRPDFTIFSLVTERRAL
jgi:hypothetical protein